MKYCKKCDTTKPIIDFHKNRSRKDGFGDYCKICASNANQKVMKKYRRGTYGLTTEQFEFLLEKQDFRCLICQISFSEQAGPVIDHDHSCCPTGVLSERYNSSKQGRPITKCGKCVRGLLCKSCNSGLGMFGDSIQRMISAISYLQSYSPEDFLIDDISLERLEIIVEPI